MYKLEKAIAELMATFGSRQSIAQPIAPRRQFAELVIGGLLLVLALGGFVM